jgi:riboflavin kinase/FMN adenylyltransferase
MIVHQGYDNLSLTRPVVTLGTFDGVHLGHRQLINAVVNAAQSQNGDSVIITFYPHPRQVVGNENHDFFFLSTPEEKLAMLEQTGKIRVI